uniref:Uncharacterized protein n=1 Tax=Trypanosoma congolense (strain IL3000) TaxID=1068625 RepID=F9WI28_TRYCI|nr:hypothetical protein, unlikely [Trypanosoma congolense IL3000]
MEMRHCLVSTTVDLWLRPTLSFSMSGDVHRNTRGISTSRLWKTLQEDSPPLYTNCSHSITMVTGAFFSPTATTRSSKRRSFLSNQLVRRASGHFATRTLHYGLSIHTFFPQRAAKDGMSRHLTRLSKCGY